MVSLCFAVVFALLFLLCFHFLFLFFSLCDCSLLLPAETLLLHRQARQKRSTLLLYIADLYGWCTALMCAPNQYIPYIASVHFSDGLS